MWRSLAAGTLVFWITAQILCAVHCNLGGGHDTKSASARPSCHGGQNAPSKDRADSKNEAPGTSSACLTLKTALPAVDLLSISAPQQLAYVLDLFVQGAELLFDLDKRAEFRQHRRPDMTLALEVSIGLTHRPLGPPFFLV